FFAVCHRVSLSCREACDAKTHIWPNESNSLVQRVSACHVERSRDISRCALIPSNKSRDCLVRRPTLSPLPSRPPPSMSLVPLALFLDSARNDKGRGVTKTKLTDQFYRIALTHHSFHEHSTINACHAIVSLRYFLKYCRFFFAGIGIERDHHAAPVALKNGTYYFLFIVKVSAYNPVCGTT